MKEGSLSARNLRHWLSLICIQYTKWKKSFKNWPNIYIYRCMYVCIYIDVYMYSLVLLFLLFTYFPLNQLSNWSNTSYGVLFFRWAMIISLANNRELSSTPPSFSLSSLPPSPEAATAAFRFLHIFLWSRKNTSWKETHPLSVRLVKNLSNK